MNQPAVRIRHDNAIVGYKMLALQSWATAAASLRAGVVVWEFLSFAVAGTGSMKVEEIAGHSSYLQN